MFENENLIDGILLSVGSAFGLSQIESILGMIILIIQVIWLICKGVRKIYILFRDGVTHQDIDEAFDIAENTFNDVLDEVENGKHIK